MLSLSYPISVQPTTRQPQPIAHTRASLIKWVLGIFYLVGVFGFWLGKEQGFPYLTPINMLLTCSALIMLGHKGSKVWIWLAVVSLGGWAAEAIGTNTGWLFGEYSYGSVLGYGLLHVPLILAANWLIVVYAIAALLEPLPFKNWQFIIIGGAIATLLDMLIEPIAISYGFWGWHGESVPLSNYVSWFVLTSVFLMIYLALNIRLRNPLGGFVLGVQFLFFLILNLLSWIF